MCSTQNAAGGGGRMTAAWDAPVAAGAPPAPGRWAEQAACRHEDPDLFFPPEEEHGRYAVLRETLAKRICLGCPVLGECTSYALTHDERYGVCSGLTPAERDRLPPLIRLITGAPQQNPLRPGCFRQSAHIGSGQEACCGLTVTRPG